MRVKRYHCISFRLKWYSNSIANTLGFLRQANLLIQLIQ